MDSLEKKTNPLVKKQSASSSASFKEKAAENIGSRVNNVKSFFKKKAIKEKTTENIGSRVSNAKSFFKKAIDQAPINKKFFINKYENLINALKKNEDKIYRGETTSYDGIKMHTSSRNMLVQSFSDSLKEIKPEHLKYLSLNFSEETKELKVTSDNAETGYATQVFQTDVESLEELYQQDYDQFIQMENDSEKVEKIHKKNEQLMIVDYGREYNLYINDGSIVQSLSMKNSDSQLPPGVITVGKNGDERLAAVTQVLDKYLPIDTHTAQRLQLEQMLSQAGFADMFIHLVEKTSGTAQVLQPNIIGEPYKKIKNLRDIRLYVINENSFFLDMSSIYCAISSKADTEDINYSDKSCLIENRAQFLFANDSFHVVGNQDKIIRQP